jgi:hypothetical protein
MYGCLRQKAKVLERHYQHAHDERKKKDGLRVSLRHPFAYKFFACAYALANPEWLPFNTRYLRGGSSFSNRIALKTCWRCFRRGCCPRYAMQDIMYLRTSYATARRHPIGAPAHPMPRICSDQDMHTTAVLESSSQEGECLTSSQETC